MGAMASRTTGVSIVYSTVCSCGDQRKHQSFASLPFVRGIHRWPVNSPHKWSVTRKMFSSDDVIMGHLIAAATEKGFLGIQLYNWVFTSPYYPVYNAIYRLAYLMFDTLTLKRNGRNFADIFECVFWKEMYFYFDSNPLCFGLHGTIDSKPSSVLVLVWHQQATCHYRNQFWDGSLTHICITLTWWGHQQSSFISYSIAAYNTNKTGAWITK